MTLNCGKDVGGFDSLRERQFVQERGSIPPRGANFFRTGVTLYMILLAILGALTIIALVVIGVVSVISRIK